MKEVSDVELRRSLSQLVNQWHSNHHNGIECFELLLDKLEAIIATEKQKVAITELEALYSDKKLTAQNYRIKIAQRLAALQEDK